MKTQGEIEARYLRKKESRTLSGLHGPRPKAFAHT